MAIPIPVTRTKIATASWGIPVTNEVNRLTTQSNTNTTDIAALKTTTAVGAWTYISPLNGFTNFGGSECPFRYRKMGDMVYVQGSVKAASQPAAPGQVVIGNLPAGYRPTYNIISPALFGGSDGWGGTGRLDVTIAGNVQIVSSAAMLGAHSITAFNISFATV